MLCCMSGIKQEREHFKRAMFTPRLIDLFSSQTLRPI